MLIHNIISIDFIIQFFSMLCLKQIENNIKKNITACLTNSKIFFYKEDIFLIKNNISFVINESLVQYDYNLASDRYFN